MSMIAPIPFVRAGKSFHGQFWRVVIVTLTVVAFSTLPAGARHKIKLVVISAVLAIAALDLFRPLEQDFPLG
jgi:hypothetical protein